MKPASTYRIEICDTSGGWDKGGGALKTSENEPNVNLGSLVRVLSKSPRIKDWVAFEVVFEISFSASRETNLPRGFSNPGER